MSRIRWDKEAPSEVAVVDSSNAEVGKVALPQAFRSPISDAVMFEEVLAQRASRRRGTASTKTRGEVSGGGKKPWRQKGTGRARAGSVRSPLWRGGGTIFGPRPRSYAYDLPRSARRAALRSALSQKARDGQLRIVEALTVENPKTKRVKTLLAGLGVTGSALIVIAERDRNLELGARNLPNVLVLPAAGINVYDILRYETLLVTRAALDVIDARVSK